MEKVSGKRRGTRWSMTFVLFSELLWVCQGDEDWCKVALSCRIAMDLLTVGSVQVARVRRWSGLRSSGR